jgi:hypothetical protein
MLIVDELSKPSGYLLDCITARIDPLIGISGGNHVPEIIGRNRNRMRPNIACSPGNRTDGETLVEAEHLVCVVIDVGPLVCLSGPKTTRVDALSVAHLGGGSSDGPSAPRLSLTAQSGNARRTRAFTRRSSTMTPYNTAIGSSFRKTIHHTSTASRRHTTFIE